MSEAASPAPAAPKGEEQPETLGSFAWFVLKLALIVLIFRSFFFSPFNIPSESMLPRLMNGDYLLAAKWPYGFSRYSLPWNLPLIPGRIFESQPERGDVVIFKHPLDGTDYIKRVIGLPGDTVAMENGEVILNGRKLARRRVQDFVVPVSANTDCAWPIFSETSPAGVRQCRYARYQETLPDGTTYSVLDFGATPQDSFAPVVVPEGRMFLLGDNRDNSQDSRFPAEPAGGIGLVPQDNLVGRASAMMWSTDGSSEWLKPWTWFSAARWDRIGRGI